MQWVTNKLEKKREINKNYKYSKIIINLWHLPSLCKYIYIKWSFTTNLNLLVFVPSLTLASKK